MLSKKNVLQGKWSIYFATVKKATITESISVNRKKHTDPNAHVSYLIIVSDAEME